MLGLRWLYVGESLYECRIELPKGWSASEPIPLDLKESFAEFYGDSQMDGNVLVTKRHLVLKASAIPPDELRRYEAFQKAIAENHALFIFLHPVPEALHPTH